MNHRTSAVFSLAFRGPHGSSRAGEWLSFQEMGKYQPDSVHNRNTLQLIGTIVMEYQLPTATKWNKYQLDVDLIVTSIYTLQSIQFDFCPSRAAIQEVGTTSHSKLVRYTAQSSAKTGNKLMLQHRVVMRGNSPKGCSYL